MKRLCVLAITLVSGLLTACGSDSQGANETRAASVDAPTPPRPSERSASDASGRFTATFVPEGLELLFVHDDKYEEDQGVYLEAYGADPGAPVDVFVQTIRLAQPVRADEAASAVGARTAPITVKEAYEGVRFESPTGYSHLVWVENERMQISVLGWQRPDDELLKIATGLEPGDGH